MARTTAMARRVQATSTTVLLLLLVAIVAVAQVAAQGDCSASSPCPSTSDCCSQYGYCGNTDDHCGTGCTAGPCTGITMTTPTTPSTPTTPDSPTTPTTPDTPSPAGGASWSSFFTEEYFNSWFPSRNALYTYQGFMDATAAYPDFGTSGSSDDQKREIAAFFGNVQHESGGLQFASEMNPTETYCDPNNAQYPCAAGKTYIGRGPIQLSWNYNYGPCGDSLNLDLLANPDQVAENGGTALKTALWFWMTNDCHGAILASPPSFANTIKKINGAKECGLDNDDRVTSRVDAYVGFCGQLGVDPGTDLRC